MRRKHSLAKLVYIDKRHINRVDLMLSDGIIIAINSDIQYYFKMVHNVVFF